MRAAGSAAPRVPSPNRSVTAPRPRRKRRCPGFRLHSGSRFINEYDLNAPWRHEVRVEQVPGYLARRHEVVAGRALTVAVKTGAKRPPPHLTTVDDALFEFEEEQQTVKTLL